MKTIIALLTVALFGCKKELNTLSLSQSSNATITRNFTVTPPPTKDSLGIKPLKLRYNTTRIVYTRK